MAYVCTQSSNVNLIYESEVSKKGTEMCEKKM